MKRKLLCMAALTALLAGPAAAQNMEYSVVPAMSSVKRLPTTEPTDGVKSGVLGFVAAKGEFEPASFVIKSDKAAKKVVLTPTDLKNAKGDKIPASALDLKIIKVWYQAGTGWHSYFADTTGRTLVPELLLNDETLVKVDPVKKDNYLRVTNPQGKVEHVWISNYVELEIPFDTWKNTIADAPTFQPFTLDANAWKQIWVTVEAPKKAEGLYKGEIKVTIDGKKMQSIPVAVRVLPFELPTPMTNYDLSRVYYTSTYNGLNLAGYLLGNGKDWKTAEARLRANYKNLKRHNMLNPMVRTARAMGYRWKPEEQDEIFRRQITIYKECGLDTSALFDAVRGIPDNGYLMHKDRKLPLAEQKLPPYWEKDILAGKKMVEEILGKGVDIYCFGWDEPSMARLRGQRLPWKFLHDNGLKTYSTAHSAHLLHGGYNEDFVNYGGSYDKASAAKWHAIGARITTYAAPLWNIRSLTGCGNIWLTRRCEYSLPLPLWQLWIPCVAWQPSPSRTITAGRRYLWTTRFPSPRAVTPWWKRCSRGACLSPMIPTWTQGMTCAPLSPAPTWRVNPPICDRWRSLYSWHRSAPLSPPAAPTLAW